MDMAYFQWTTLSFPLLLFWFFITYIVTWGRTNKILLSLDRRPASLKMFSVYPLFGICLWHCGILLSNPLPWLLQVRTASASLIYSQFVPFPSLQNFFSAQGGSEGKTVVLQGRTSQRRERNSLKISMLFNHSSQSVLPEYSTVHLGLPCPLCPSKILWDHNMGNLPYLQLRNKNIEKAHCCMKL